MPYIPALDTICTYLGVDESVLKDPDGATITIKVELLRLILQLVVAELPFDPEWYLETNPDMQAHWNVRGASFIAIHQLFDKVADAVEGYSDTIAERAGALGGTAEGTIQIAVEHSFLPRYQLGIADAGAHIAAVTAALAAFGDAVRNAIDDTASSGDADTSDVFTEISRGVDQQLWLVESHRQP